MLEQGTVIHLTAEEWEDEGKYVTIRMSRNHQVYHVSVEHNDNGQHIVVLIPNRTCPYCLRGAVR